MTPIPDQWIDKLFNCLKLFYGERFHLTPCSPTEELVRRSMWKNGLLGLNHDQIKYGLQLCKRAAEEPSALPPHVNEFYLYAIGQKVPYVNHYRKTYQAGSAEVQKAAMAEIKQRLGRTASSNG